MINLIETPQRADFKAEYIVNNDILTVKINDVTETFDFTGLAEGVAEEIAVETLPINPIISAEKIGETVFQFLIGIINQYKEAYMKLRELSFNSS